MGNLRTNAQEAERQFALANFTKDPEAAEVFRRRGIWLQSLPPNEMAPSVAAIPTVMRIETRYQANVAAEQAARARGMTGHIVGPDRAQTPSRPRQPAKPSPAVRVPQSARRPATTRSRRKAHGSQRAWKVICVLILLAFAAAYLHSHLGSR